MASMADWRVWMFAVWCGLLAVIAGFFGALLLGLFVLGPIYSARGEMNGGPFAIGDHVQIIAGPHRGTTTRVYSTWQHDTVRVELGPKVSETFGDIFSASELLRLSGGHCKSKAVDDAQTT